MKTMLAAVTLVWMVALLAGCGPKASSRTTLTETSSNRTSAAAWPNPISLVLVPQEGNGRTDAEIRRFQAEVREAKKRNPALEQLGWAFVSKARESFDSGYYKLAEQCALAIEQNDPQNEAAMLLRGHVLDSLHRFHEAEALAQQLVDRRGRAFDYGLLGDALMEQGRLTEAVAAYQHMIDRRPDLHAYARAAHMRWLTGDLEGAMEAMNLAVSAASPSDAESAAWANTRLAVYHFQAGRLPTAAGLCTTALQFQTNYPPALLLRGKMLLAGGKPNEAVGPLQIAAQLNPLPEFQWALADALRAGGREAEAAAVEAQLCQRGAASDPRTLAIFLATRRESTATAVRLAREELVSRGDIFTHDALAWALHADGDAAAARAEMKLAVAEGTQDARLFFHAATITADAGETREAKDWTKKSEGIAQMLLPSERDQLRELSRRLANARTTVAREPSQPISAF